MAAGRTTLPTWAKRRKFQYSGSAKAGTRIYCGKDFGVSFPIEGEHYAAMSEKFSGQEVSIGTSRTTPPKGSPGEWLKKTYQHGAVTSYVGPILISEGYAEYGSASDRIRFFSS
jgi:hypothetical protein